MLAFVISICCYKPYQYVVIAVMLKFAFLAGELFFGSIHLMLGFVITICC